MSINSQILATMQSEGHIDESGLDLPDVNVGAPLQVDTSNPHASQQTPVTDDLRRRLLSPSTSFKTVSEGVTKVISMEEVQKEIAQDKAVSFASAKEVSMTFESFGDKFSLNEFSKQPTQVNFKPIMGFMQNEIRMRQERISTEAESFFNGHLTDSEDAFKDYQGFYAVNLYEDLQEFRNKLIGLTNDPSFWVYQLFPHGSGEVNIATTPLETFPEDFSGPGDLMGFMKAISNIQGLLTTGIHTKNLVVTIRDKLGLAEFADPQKSAQALSLNPSLKDFIEMFKDDYLEKFIRNMEASAEQAISELNNIQKDCDVNPTEFNSVRDFVVNNGEAIDEQNERIHYFIEIVELVKTLYLNMTKATEYLQLK